MARPAVEGGAGDDTPLARGYRAVATLYHAYLTGLILTVVTRRGAAAAAEIVFRVFRRQQREKFLPGLAKLGRLVLTPVRRIDLGDDAFEWRLRRRP